jgi:hypothetical protein
MSERYDRGTVVKGPDLFADHPHRPYVCLSDDSHPFSDEEALYAASTNTRRAIAIPRGDDDFATPTKPTSTPGPSSPTSSSKKATSSTRQRKHSPRKPQDTSASSNHADRSNRTPDPPTPATHHLASIVDTDG